MPKFYTGGAGASVKAAAVNDVEVADSKLRLRCRPSHTPANKAALVLDCNQILPVAISPGIYGIPSFKDLAGHVNACVLGCYALAANKRFAGDVVAYNTRGTNSSYRVDPDFAVNDDAFTLDIEFRLHNVVLVFEIANVYTVEAGDRAWKLTYNGNQTFTWTLYGAGGATRTLTIDCTAWPLLVNTWYDLRISYNLAGPQHVMEIRRPSDNARITGSAVDTIALNKPASLARPGLVIGGLFTYVEPTGLYNAKLAFSPYVQRVTYYKSYLGTGLAAIAARPTFYAAATAGDADGVSALVSLDSGAAGSTWDVSSLSADDESNFAAILAGGGWEVRYQISNAAPSAWSAWMTWTTLKTEADAAGRYFHIGLRATGDGYNEFYPLGWISCDAIVPTTPTTPVLSNFLRDEAAGSVDTTGDAGVTIEVWAASLLDSTGTENWEKVGSRVGPGAVVLDFTSFVEMLGPVNILQAVKIIAWAISPAGLYSAASNVIGFAVAPSGAITTSGVSLSLGGTLTFTVAGLADPDDQIAWFAYNGGALVALVTTGNGPQTWAGGFDPYNDNTFIGFGQDRTGHLLLMPLVIYVDAIAGSPYCRPTQAPGLEESP